MQSIGQLVPKVLHKFGGITSFTRFLDNLMWMGLKEVSNLWSV